MARTSVFSAPAFSKSDVIVITTALRNIDSLKSDHSLLTLGSSKASLAISISDELKEWIISKSGWVFSAKVGRVCGRCTRLLLDWPILEFNDS